MISKQNQPWMVSISQRCMRPAHSPLSSPVSPRMRPSRPCPSLRRAISAVKPMPQSRSSSGSRSQFQPKVQLTCREEDVQFTSGSRSTSKGLTSSACYLSASLSLARRWLTKILRSSEHSLKQGWESLAVLGSTRASPSSQLSYSSQKISEALLPLRWMKACSGESPPVCPYSCDWLLLLRSSLIFFASAYLAANSACTSASFGTAAIHLLVKTASNESTLPNSKPDTNSFASSEKPNPFLNFLTTFSICSQNLWMCLSLRNLAKGSLLESLLTKGLRAVQRLMMSSPSANSRAQRVGSGDSVELDQPARTAFLSAVRSTFSARRLGCKTPLECAYASASTTCPVKNRAAVSDTPPFQRRYSSRSPPDSSGKSRSSPLSESASLEESGWLASNGLAIAGWSSISSVCFSRWQWTSFADGKSLAMQADSPRVMRQRLNDERVTRRRRRGRGWAPSWARANWRQNGFRACCPSSGINNDSRDRIT